MHGAAQFTAEEQEWVDAFLAETTLFLGPDPEIMNDHRMAPRTAEEDRLLSGPVDANDLDRVRKRIVAGLDEAFEMMEQTGAAPGAKWGDLTSAVYSASGDLIHISTGGVLAFASVLHYPVRFINKYWIGDPTVGVHDGDAFIHNDARYGNIHNTDQSMILPVFYDGELIAWVATIIHEGENGAKEPGGMPSSSESAYDDGIRMSPFKIVEQGRIRRDLLTFLQNSVREPKLQYQDLKVKLYSAQRIKDRLIALVDEVGRDAFIASLRKSLEDIEAEARRRISALPDGTFRVNFFSDSTLRENVLLKYPCAITVRGDEMTIDWRGAAPQFLNRAFNATLGTAKCGLGQALLGFFWPDLPRGISVMNPMEVLTDEGSCINPGLDAPLGQSLQGAFKTFGVCQSVFAKVQYSCPEKYGSVIAPWFNQINTFLFGGVTQHGEFVGNVCADLNGMGGGARAHRDGEHSMAPFFAAMADLGEQEIIEDDVPFLQLISKKIKRDAQGFGKYRGGMGYEIAVAGPRHPAVGFRHGVQRLEVPGHPRPVRRVRMPGLPAGQDQGRERLRAAADGAGELVLRLRDADERPAVRRRPVLHPPHGHGLRARRRGRGLHDLPGHRRRLRRRARARPGRGHGRRRGGLPVQPGGPRDLLRRPRPGHAGGRRRRDRGRPGRRAPGPAAPRPALRRVRQGSGSPRNRPRTCPTTARGATTTASSTPPPGARTDRCG